MSKADLLSRYPKAIVHLRAQRLRKRVGLILHLAPGPTLGSQIGNCLSNVLPPIQTSMQMIFSPV